MTRIKREIYQWAVLAMAVGTLLLVIGGAYCWATLDSYNFLTWGHSALVALTILSFGMALFAVGGALVAYTLSKGE